MRLERTSARLRRRPSARWSARLATYVGLGFIATLALLVGGFFLALSQGPISFPWLAPRIVQSLREMSGGRYDFSLKTASLANTDHGPTLTVDGLVVKREGRAILAAPRAELSLDLGSLLIGRVRPRRVEALDLELRLSVTPDGAVAISAGAEPVAAAPAIAPAPAATAPDAGTPPRVERVALLREAAAALRGMMNLATSPDGPIGALDRIGVAHGKLVIDDRTVDRVIRYDDVMLRLDKGPGAMAFALSANGPSRRWTAYATAKGAPGARRIFNAKVRDLSIDEIALVGGFRNDQLDSDAPIGLDLEFALGADDAVADASGNFEIGHGFFRLEDPNHEPVMIERIAGAAKWDRVARKVALSPLRFNAGGFDMSLLGEVRPPAKNAQGPDAESWALTVRLDKPTTVTPERAAQKPVQIDSGALEAHVLRAQRLLVIDKFGFEGPEAHVALTGSVMGGDDTRVAFELGVEDTQLRAIARLWPTHVAAPVRAWFADHVAGGVVKSAKYVASFDEAALTAMRYERAPADEAMLLEGEIVNASVDDLLPGMSPISGVSGRLRVTGRTAQFAATSGMMEPAAGRRLTISEGRFTVSDGALRPTPAFVDLRLSGGVDAVADVLALPSVAKHAGLPVDPATLKGQVDGKVRVDFEIGDLARDEHTGFFVDAMTANLTVDKLIGKEKLEGGALHVVADKAGLRVTGAGRIYGAPANLELRRAAGEKAGQAQLTLTFDDAVRQRAGYVVAGIVGPVAATIRTPLPIADVNTQIDLDFTRTTFDNPLPGFVKASGKAAKATFQLAHRGDAYALEQLSFDAGATQAQGLIELTKEGGFRAARLTQARLSPGDDMKVDIARSGDGVKIVARGANFDARPVLQALLHSGAARTGKSAFEDVDVDFKSPIVTGHGKQILANVDLKMERRGGRPRALTLSGSFGREQLAVTMQRNRNGAPQLEIATNDAGSFLAFLDLYRKMDNGVLNASVQLVDDRADGAMGIRDFYVRGEPTVRQLMAQGGVNRTDERGNYRFDPDSVRVGRLQSDFTWSAGRLQLREGVLSGPEIGLTFDGFMDFAHDRLDVAGSYVPAYALNSLLSNIPVLGVVLAGGQHEGVFAVNYRVTGAMSAPIVNVNPLSAMAPGLLRKIMGVLDGTARAPNGR